MKPRRKTSLWSQIARRSSPGEAGRLIAQGDSCRDRRDWAGAVQAYQGVLALEPDNAGIWVQLGHALKESGRRNEGYQAYLRANSLEPGNSDTAIQIAHVLKLMQRYSDAIEWYWQAATRLPGEKRAVIELLALGVDYETIVPRLRGLSLASRARPGALMWDVTRLVSGPEDLRGARWWGDLGKALAAKGLVQLCHVSPSQGEWHSLPADFAVASSFFCAAPMPEQVAMVLVQGMAYRQASEAQRLALESLRSRYDAAVVTFMSGADYWSSPDHLDALDGVLARSSLILAPTLEEAEAFAGRARQKGQNLSALPLTLPPSDAGELGAPLTPPGEHLLLLAAGTALPGAVMEALAMRPDARLCLMCEDAQEPVWAADLEKVSSALVGRLRVLPPAKAPALPPDCASLLLYGPLCEAQVWASAALDAGLPVGAPVSSVFRVLYGRSAMRFPAFSSPQAIANFWDCAAPRPASNVEAARWVTGFSLFLEAAHSAPPADIPSQARLHTGIFYSLSSRQSHLCLREGTGWGEAGPAGCLITGEKASLRFFLAGPVYDACHVALLVSTSTAKARDVTLELHCEGRPLRTQASIGESGWGWVSTQVEPSSLQGAGVVLEIGFPGAHEEATPPLVCGLIIYPQSQDHLWHEFLDAASRGFYPEITRVRMSRTLTAATA